MTGIADRDTLNGARASLRGLEAEWRRHVKICGTCIVLTAAGRRYCDAGWEIAKGVVEGRRRVGEFTPPPPPESGTLF